MFEVDNPAHRASFLRLATLFEGGLLVVAYLLGWVAGSNPIGALRFDAVALLWGVLGVIPLYLLFLLSYSAPVEQLHQIKRFLIDKMGAILAACRLRDLVYLSLLAGITEETLFRGALQPMLESHLGWAAGLLASNLLFALAHAITPLYALLAGLTGIYLGIALDFGGERNLLIPILIHSLYDLLAFMAVAHSYRAERSQSF